MTLTYVTGNHGKYLNVKNHFDNNNLSLEFYKYNLSEPDINDIEVISKAKVTEAYRILQKPCFVADSGFYIKAYPNNPNYPGAFVKRSGVSTNIKELLNILKDTKDRRAYFLDCLTFYDGKDYYSFYGKSEGNISYEIKGENSEKSLSNLWYIFVPKNHNKTLAEMTDEERENRQDNHTSATEEFINWYKKEYLNSQKKIKKLI